MSGTFDQEKFDRELITTFLLAYPKTLVMDVVRTISVAEHRHRQAHGWKLFHGTREDIPDGMQWVQISNRFYVRSIADAELELAELQAAGTVIHNKVSQSKPPKKTDTTVRKADMLCPMCHSEMFREPICRGCKEGKAGYRVRLICGENDEHTWIV